MEFERKDPDCKITVPDVLTVRQQLAFYSSIPTDKSGEFFERLWDASRALIQKWECPLFPDKDADLDQVSDPEIPMILIWATTQIRHYIDGLKSIPKNS